MGLVVEHKHSVQIVLMIELVQTVILRQIQLLEKFGKIVFEIGVIKTKDRSNEG
jgi:hypothetical protein